jgi:F-type H+-transporting ATPase subunit delta
MQTTHHTPTVLAYANSLLELAEEQNQAAPIGEELNQIGEILDQNPTFVEFLGDPGISHEERERTLAGIFGGKLNPLLWNFLGVLNLKRRMNLLGQIITAYDDLLDEKYGKIEVDVTTAHTLSADDLENVRQRVSTALKKDAVIHQYVDESIIGGMLLRVQDQLIDASVRSQLEKIKQSMLSVKKA